jgi:hypothetical protein
LTACTKRGAAPKFRITILPVHEIRLPKFDHLPLVVEDQHQERDVQNYHGKDDNHLGGAAWDEQVGNR